MTENGHPPAAGERRDRGADGAPVAVYVVRWYRALVGGWFFVFALLCALGALPVLGSQPGPAAFLLGLAALSCLAAANGATLARLSVYRDGLLVGRGVLLPARWIARSRIDHVALGRASSAVAAPFVIPVVHCRDGRRYRLQSMRALRRHGRAGVAEQIVEDLQRWLAGVSPPSGVT